jgi:hypothetical protein
VRGAGWKREYRGGGGVKKSVGRKSDNGKQRLIARRIIGGQGIETARGDEKGEKKKTAFSATNPEERRHKG